MARDYKILGQVAPSATTMTEAYKVPAATKAIISTIVIANHAGSAGTFRLAARPNADSLLQKHYLAYDIPIAANDSTTLTLGVTLDSAELIEVYCSSGDMSVNIFGSEIS
jgi:hypothetical protein